MAAAREGAVPKDRGLSPGCSILLPSLCPGVPASGLGAGAQWWPGGVTASHSLWVHTCCKGPA